MKKNKLLIDRSLEALIPALMSGCATWLLMRAIGFDVSALTVYAVSIAVSAAITLGRNGTVWMIGAAVTIVGGFAAVLAFGLSNLNGFFRMVRESGGASAEVLAACAPAGRTIALLLGIGSSALITLMFRTQSGKPFAILLPVASILIALTLRQDLSIWSALPGFIGCIVTFAMSAGMRRENVRLPVVAAAVCMTVIAMLVSPGTGTTWEPLEQLAEKIRMIADEYVHFTEERVAFSINEKGYDHGGMVSEQVVSMLGGPADPTDDAVMKVKTDRDVLLRGTIKSTYTGYSWVDTRVKARYLYYDFTHAATRKSVFDMDKSGLSKVFSETEVEVEILEQATSTLFVPAHMTSFDMDLSDAVYYNSTGEVFLTRDVQKGDTYSLKVQVTNDDDALTAAALQAESIRDQNYERACQDYLELPSGISDKVYALSISVTEGKTSAVEKAIAIREYLSHNYRYTLNAGYPEPNEDFVSWFLFQEKQGYCSYFASAMAVMCRIAGVPARYVEGYYVHSGSTETIVTGHNAHAWVEVYLNGIGWTAFDPTASAYTVQYGYPQQNETAPNENSGLGDAGTQETPFGDDDEMLNDGTNGGSDEDSGSSSDGDSGDSDSQNDEGDSGGDASGNEDLDGGDSPDGDEPENNDDGSDQDNSESDSEEDQPDSENDPAPQQEEPPESQSENNSSGKYLWIIIAVLLLAAIIALAVLWIRKRLNDTDPLNMCKKTKSAKKAALIMYRAILTLLVQLGYAPMNGETPEMFAARVCQTIPNDQYVRFVAAVTRSCYSDGGLKRSELECGRDAYLEFLGGMKRGERVRYDIRRVLNGIGDTESIP